MKKAKKDHFANLSVNLVLDNRKFWQNVKLLFSNKVKAKLTIKLIENDEVIDNELKSHKYLANLLSIFLKKVGIFTEQESATFPENNLNEVERFLKIKKATLV